MWANLNDAEVQLLLWIQGYLRNDFLTPFFKFITKFGDHGIFWIALCVLLLAIPATRRNPGIHAAMSLILNFIINNLVLKNWIARIRPYDWSMEVQLITQKPHDFSFPSGHAGAAFSVAMAIYLSGHKKIGSVMLVLASLIALSRPYLGVHYPTDVVAGTIVGCVAAYVMCTILYLKNKKKK